MSLAPDICYLPMTKGFMLVAIRDRNATQDPGWAAIGFTRQRILCRDPDDALPPCQSAGVQYRP